MDAAQEQFLQSLEHHHGYVHLLAQHRRRFRVPAQEMQLFSESLAEICWAGTQPFRVLGGSVELDRAKAELEKARTDFKTKLVQCNLSAMKQLELAKGGSGQPPEDESVFFYEPLQYLNKEHKDLVLMIIIDKLRQIFDGSAPHSLLEELRKVMAVDPGALDGFFGEQAKSNQQSKSKTGQSCRKRRRIGPNGEEEWISEDEDDAFDRADAAEEEARIARRQAEEAKAQIAHLLQELRQLRGESEAEAGRAGRLGDDGERHRQLAADGERHRIQLEAALQKLQELGVSPDEIGASTELPVTLAGADEATDGLYIPTGARSSDGKPAWQKASPDGTRRSLCSTTGKWVVKDGNGSVLISEAASAQQAGNPLEVQSWVDAEGRPIPLSVARPVGRDRASSCTETGVQTTLAGTRLAELLAENRKFKVVLEELQTKIKQLMARCRAKGLDVQDVAEELGLKEVLKNQTSFERLYQDAFRRIERLEKLRDQVRQERLLLRKGRADAAEPSVLSSVEQSNLSGLRSFLTELLPAQALHSPLSRQAANSRVPREACAIPPADAIGGAGPAAQPQQPRGRGLAILGEEQREHLPQIAGAPGAARQRLSRWSSEPNLGAVGASRQRQVSESLPLIASRGLQASGDHAGVARKRHLIA